MNQRKVLCRQRIPESSYANKKVADMISALLHASHSLKHGFVKIQVINPGELYGKNYLWDLLIINFRTAFREGKGYTPPRGMLGSTCPRARNVLTNISQISK